MSSLTSSEVAEVHTELLTHLVEAASMKAEIEHLKSTQADLTHRLLVSVAEVAGDVRAMRQELQGVPDRIQTCRQDMRREIEKDFPDKVDAIEMEKRIEKQVESTDRKLSDQMTRLESKVDKIWVKITTSILTVSAILGMVAWIVERLLG